MVALGELALGIALVIGFLTRVAAACGLLLLLTILLGQTYVPGSSWVNWVTAGLTTKFAILLLLLILAVGHAAWGLDGRSKTLRRSRLR
jgi:uncharacterized membrane protein YphA (DoxX/SURF4 family)